LGEGGRRGIELGEGAGYLGSAVKKLLEGEFRLTKKGRGVRWWKGVFG
jgi:hypothetical protein